MATEASEIEIVNRRFVFGEHSVGRPNLKTEAAFAEYMNRAVRAQILAGSSDVVSLEAELRGHRNDVTSGEYMFGRQGFRSALANPIHIGQWLRYWLLQVKVDKTPAEWKAEYDQQRYAWAKEAMEKMAGKNAAEIQEGMLSGELLSPWDKNLKDMLDDPNPLAP